MKFTPTHFGYQSGRYTLYQYIRGYSVWVDLNADFRCLARDLPLEHAKAICIEHAAGQSVQKTQHDQPVEEGQAR